MTVVTIEDLEFQFSENNEPIIQDFDLTIEHGEFVIIKGDNGSGKSTLLRVIAGIIPKTLSVKALMYNTVEEKSIVFQDPTSQILTFKVGEEVVSKLSFKGLARDLRTKRLQELVRIFQLENLIEKDPRRISSGQQQIVISLASMVDKPSLLLLDEPFTYLDQENINLTKDYLHSLKKLGIAIVIVTHLDVMDDSCDKIMYLTDGEENNRLKLRLGGEITNTFWIDGVIGYNQDLVHINSKFGSTGTYGIIGANGSGKTCLLLSLQKIIDLRAGDLYFPDDAIYVPQKASYTFSRATVLEELEGIPLPEWLQLYHDYSPFQLSVGYQKVFAIYLALHRSSVCLIDEPFQSLDKKLTRLVITMFQDFQNDNLIIFSSNRELAQLGIVLEDQFIIKV